MSGDWIAQIGNVRGAWIRDIQILQVSIFTARPILLSGASLHNTITWEKAVVTASSRPPVSFSANSVHTWKRDAPDKRSDYISACYMPYILTYILKSHIPQLVLEWGHLSVYAGDTDIDPGLLPLPHAVSVGPQKPRSASIAYVILKYINGMQEKMSSPQKVGRFLPGIGKR